MEKKVPLELLLKAALVARYAAGRGGHHTAGKVGQRASRRDGTREWNEKHPDNPVSLRVKTGRPSAHPRDWFNTKENSKNWRKQVPAKRKKEQ